MQMLIMVLTVINQLFPLVIQIVRQVEGEFPDGGKGALKLKAVRDTLEAAFKDYSDAKVTFDQLWPTLKVMVDSAVALYNATGKFKKAS